MDSHEDLCSEQSYFTFKNSLESTGSSEKAKSVCEARHLPSLKSSPLTTAAKWNLQVQRHCSSDLVGCKQWVQSYCLRTLHVNDPKASGWSL